LVPFPKQFFYLSRVGWPYLLVPFPKQFFYHSHIGWPFLLVPLPEIPGLEFLFFGIIHLRNFSASHKGTGIHDIQQGISKKFYEIKCQVSLLFFNIKKWSKNYRRKKYKNFLIHSRLI
jgi:hypothetical protein